MTHQSSSEKPISSEERKRRPVRSYVLRKGRVTEGQRRALEELWPVYGLEEAPRRPLFERDVRIAENLLDIRRRHPDRLVVAILGQAHLAGEGSVGDRLVDASVRVLVRPSTALADSVSDEHSEMPFSNLPALGERAFLLRPSGF